MPDLRTTLADVAPYIEAARKAGARTPAELAEALTNRDVRTPAGKGQWRPEQIRRVLAGGNGPAASASTQEEAR